VSLAQGVGRLQELFGAVYDSHCHLDSERFDADRDAVIQRALDRGVEGMMLAGVDRAGRSGQEALAARWPMLVLSFGVHPMVAAELDDLALASELESLAADVSRHRPRAIGEIGLDRRAILPKDSLPRQEHAFRTQLRLAREQGLPIVLHIVRAHGQALEILREGGPWRGVVHSFSGSAESALRYLELGLDISFCGTVTYPDAARIHSAARAVPLERLLVETDAPDQTPALHRPARNEPSHLPEIVAALALLRGESHAAVATSTARNARRLFTLAS
jgi:TatD DNase family protein